MGAQGSLHPTSVSNAYERTARFFLDRLVHLQAPYVPRTQTISRYDLFMLTAEGLQASCLFQPWMHPGQKEGSYDQAHL